MYHLASWPSTIFSRIASGFACTDSSAARAAFFASRTSSGMRSMSTYCGGEAGDLHGEVADELLELVGAGHEVGLAVDLDQHADAAAGVDVAGDEALAGVAAGLLRRGGEALLAQLRDGLVHVAAGLLERALAVHHAGAGPLAQLLDGIRP